MGQNFSSKTLDQLFLCGHIFSRFKKLNTICVCLSLIRCVMMLNFSFFPGAFLFPFIIMLVILGLPLLFLETAFGQFASTGVISIWKVSPIFKGKLR